LTAALLSQRGRGACTPALSSAHTSPVPPFPPARPAAGCSEVVVEVIRGATHLFEEPGALEAVSSKASAWFAHHFAARTPAGVTVA
jgi:hypothetical protein